MSTTFITRWGGGVKATPRRVLPVVVVNTLAESIDPAEELKQYIITAPIEIYTFSKVDGAWCLQHGGSCTPLPFSTAEGMVLWLKKELENKESEVIPTPDKGYRPVLCLLGLPDRHLSMFREGRTERMYVLTERTGPILPRDMSVGLRQFYRNVDTGTYGPYHDKVVFSPDGKITIEGCETEYTHKLGLAVAACLSTRTCSLYGTV